MLYDPKWEQQAQTQTELQELIAWLETKDPSERYSYIFPSMCLVGQFLRHIGGFPINRTEAEVREMFGGLGVQIAGMGEETFGAALERARKLLPA